MGDQVWGNLTSEWPVCFIMKRVLGLRASKGLFKKEICRTLHLDEVAISADVQNEPRHMCFVANHDTDG